jgi:heavy metal sensor kinase
VKLPIRVRLTVWYALLLAAILLALGAFLVLRLRSDLRSTIDREVRDGAMTIAGNYVHEGVDGFREISIAALPRSGSATQVLSTSGRVLVGYGGAVADRPMLSAAAREAALAGRADLLELRLGRSLRPFRVMAARVRIGGANQLVVVSESLDQIDEAVRRILVLLLIAVPAALATAGLVGWWLLRTALAPVRRMTQKADEIGIDQLGERLTAPNSNDEIGRLAATLNAMLDRLEQGVETKRRLVADASHELRTPLAVMRAELDVRLRRDGLTASDREVLESVREETERMGRSVDNLLTLAQAEEGHLRLLSSELDLSEVIESAVRPLRGLAAANRIGLSTRSEPCHVVGDPQRLQLALTNLIENAIKFTPPGGEIVVSCARSRGRVGVSVRDTGRGISGEAQTRVFDRFYRAREHPQDRTATVGGGLGLAICKEIAAAHGGTVTVQSEEGRGSLFTLWLPDLEREGEAVQAPDTYLQTAEPAPLE